MRKTAVVIRDYDSAFPAPIVIRQGEYAVIGHCDLQWPGWVWVTLRCGQAGWAPQQRFSPISAHEVVCLEDYSAHELTVRTGETLTLLEPLNGWFWAQKTGGETGWVPEECVRLSEQPRPDV